MVPSTHMPRTCCTYIVLLSLSVVTACRRNDETPINLSHPREGSVPVVQWKGGVVTAEELERRFAEMPPHGRAQYESETSKAEYAEGLSHFELLAKEAVRRHLHKDPRVAHAAKGALVQALLEKLDTEGSESEPREAELRALYDTNRAQFERPERLRLLFIQMKDREKLEKLRLQAEKLSKTDFSGFGALAAAHSEDSDSRQLNGDLRYLTLDALATRLGPKAAEAATLLKAPGDLSKPIEMSSGFALLKLQDRGPGFHRGFEEVRDELRTVQRSQERAARLNALLVELKKSEGYVLDEAALRKVKVDPSAPAKTLTGAPAGFLPSAARQ